MSYVDAIYDRDSDRIYVVERDQNGKRQYKEYPTNWVFYYEDPKGKYRSIYGDKLSKFTTRKRAEFEKEKRIHSNKKLFESDINIVHRCLSENYLNVEPPKLHTAFFDIEVDFHKEKGFSSPDDPFNPVTAVSVYLDWMDQLVTLVVKPKHMSLETASEIASTFTNTLIVNEKELFETFFELIEDADVLTGWNSEGYDIPYMVNRCTKALSKDDTRKFCLMGQLPKARKYERFGKESTTYDLVGRVHMDYLQLYKKYNYEGRHSYSLDAIGEMEVDERKVDYEGTLDQLYNKDFKKFIEYNRQDTMLMVKIHNKLKFLDLANTLAHENTVLIPTVMGSVAMIEQAILNEAHERNLIVPDKKKRTSEEQTAAGAYVAVPKRGMHQWIGAVDLNSLYPSTIRALNMAPETIVGQVRHTLTDQYLHDKAVKIALEKRGNKNKSEDDLDDDDLDLSSLLWEGLFACLEYTAIMNQEPGTMLTVDYENGKSVEMSAADIWKLIFASNNNWVISANGTIFTMEKEGVIPGLLSRWYSDRKAMQKKLKEATTKEDQEYWDKRQLVRKINLNSAYGALLNAHCKYYDQRIGQSVTLTGRSIVKHQCSYINELVTGEYKHDGEAIVYGDTDSTYFSAYPTLKSSIDSGEVQWDKDTIVKLYDTIGEQVNDSFPAFMEQAFHAPRNKGSIIKSGRELIADRGIFVKKKRYAVNIFDKEGDRLDLYDEAKAKKKGVIFGMGKIKAMGLDLKRSDTPKHVQNFLMHILENVLSGKERDTIIEMVKEFKHEVAKMEPWLKGSPKSVNKLTSYAQLEAASKTGKANMPGHVRAALNWNKLRDMFNDNYSMQIVDGMRIIVCKLKPNLMGYTSIAYPTDESRIPHWFKDLPFDEEAMETTVIDKKLQNLLGVLDWKLEEATNIKSSFNDLFEIG